MAVKKSKFLKITQPQVEGVLLRKRLFERLDHGRQKPLIWISSPGGSGKTTLVSSYLAARRLPCLWYQIDSGDADPATFFYYLGLAGENASLQRRKPLPLLTAEFLSGVSDFSRIFFADLLGRLKSPSVIVFDNVQEVPDAALLHQCLIAGLSRLSEGLTFIMISRSVPPMPYVRLQTNREMDLLSWDDIRLSWDECKDIIPHWGLNSTAKNNLYDVYCKTDGWAAGLLLLLHHFQGASPVGGGDWGETSEQVFSYFADQLFDKVDKELRDFLLRTAYVSQVTPAMAEHLTDNPRSKTILNDLVRQNYFTTKRLRPILTYEYHPLFQAFLRESAKQEYSPSALRDLKSLTANSLIEESRFDEAVALLAEIEDWEPLADLICKNAQILQEQGRFGTLLSWLDALPPDLVEHRPMLLYWKAGALKPTDIFTCRDLYSKAYQLFRAAKDPVGTYLTWAGAVETFIYLWGNFRLLDPWLAEFEQIRLDHPNFPTKEIQGRVTYVMFSALLWRRSNSREMKFWSEQAERLVRQAKNETFKVLTASNLLKYYLWCCGDLAKADALIIAIRKIDQQSIKPLAALLSRVMMATYHWFMNEMEECLETVREGLDFGDETGIHLMDTALYAHAVYALLMTGRREEAKEHLKEMSLLTNEQSHIDVAHYHYLCSWLQLEEGKYPLALGSARVAVERIDAAGTRQARGFAQYTLGVALCEMGEFAEAEKAFETGRLYGTSMESGYFETAYQLCMGLLCLRQGDREGAVERVAIALPLARGKGYPTIPWIGWYRSALTGLLMLALENDIEAGYVAQLIRGHRLVPETPPVYLENWPWPIMLYTFGRFLILRNGIPLEFIGKAQQRPLEMLKSLISLGGVNVPETKLADALWPDSDGDAARQAFKITLHRLRKLLGVSDALILTDGRLTLNPRLCWVDAWTLDRVISDAESRWKQSGSPFIQREIALALKAVDLYKGPFFQDEFTMETVLPMRERLRSRFLRGVEHLGIKLEEMGRHREVVDIYHRALEVDPLVEFFYQRLMVCYRDLGRPAKAMAVYDQCRNVLSQTLGVSPSEVTCQIHQTICSAGQ